MDDSTDSFDDSQERRSPVISAAYLTDVDALRRALAAGADVNARVGNGWTAMHLVLSRPLHFKPEACAEMVSMLLEAGLDLNARDTIRGRTPLHFAVRAGRVDAVEALIAAGASLTRGASHFTRRIIARASPRPSCPNFRNSRRTSSRRSSRTPSTRAGTNSH